MPEVSVLGSLLFMIYKNDLPEGMDSYMNTFVAGAEVIREVNSEENCILLKRYLVRFQRWSDTLLMKFNSSKFEVMKN